MNFEIWFNALSIDEVSDLANHWVNDNPRLSFKEYIRKLFWRQRREWEDYNA